MNGVAWQHILTGLMAFAMVGGLWLLVWGFRLLRMQQKLVSPDLEAFEKLRLEVAQLRTELATLKAQTGHTTDGSGAYNHAIELAQHGYDAVQIALECGISRGEADLIIALHRKVN